MPPSGVQWIIFTPTVDASAICFARVILVFKCGTKLLLGVKGRKRIHVSLPTETDFSPCNAKMKLRQDTRVSVHNIEGLHEIYNGVSHREVEDRTRLTAESTS